MDRRARARDDKRSNQIRNAESLELLPLINARPLSVTPLSRPTIYGDALQRQRKLTEGFLNSVNARVSPWTTVSN